MVVGCSFPSSFSRNTRSGGSCRTGKMRTVDRSACPRGIIQSPVSTEKMAGVANSSSGRVHHKVFKRPSSACTKKALADLQRYPDGGSTIQTCDTPVHAHMPIDTRARTRAHARVHTRTQARPPAWPPARPPAHAPASTHAPMPAWQQAAPLTSCLPGFSPRSAVRAPQVGRAPAKPFDC